MKYTIYDLAAGRIEKTVSCHPDSIKLQFDAATHGYIDGEFNDDRFLVDAGAAVALPPRPSKDHAFDYAARQWIDRRTLADFRSAQWAAIKSARAASEFGGFTWDASTFDSDPMSQSRIMGVVQLAQLDPMFTITWTLADNTMRILNAQEMTAVGKALGSHAAAQHERARALRARIEAAQTAAEVAAVVW